MQSCDCVKAEGEQTPVCHHTCLTCRMARRADEMRLRNWPLALVSIYQAESKSMGRDFLQQARKVGI